MIPMPETATTEHCSTIGCEREVVHHCRACGRPTCYVHRFTSNGDPNKATCWTCTYAGSRVKPPHPNDGHFW